LSEYENEYFELIGFNYCCIVYANMGSRSTLIMYWSQVRILAGPPTFSQYNFFKCSTEGFNLDL